MLSFSCSDEFLTRYYWYRWYGLRLNTMFGSEGNYKRPFVCEGIGYFRAPISYSAQCHMLENRWHHEPELAQGSLLVFIDNHYETGQEYMHRYTVVNPEADQENWGDVFRLKGVDVTVYIYELKRALSVIAEQLSRPDEAELWNIEAEKIKNAVLLKLWDTNEEMFFDVDPTTGKRMNCPWNGRVWPMTNSHIAEALAHSAIRFRDPLLKKQAAEFISKFVRMMFLDGDPDRPNCFEHYNPFSGKPSVYREIDDYQHSWVSDLIIKYVCGIRPDQHTVTIDPFPFGLKQAQIDNVFVRGRRLKVDVKGKRFVVFLDRKQQAESAIGKPIAIQV